MLQDLTCASAQPVVEQAYPGTGCRREQGNPGARSREWSGPVSDKTTAARDSATGLPNCEVLLFAATPSTRGQHQASERELYAALSEMPRVQRESLSGPPRRPPFHLRPNSHAAGTRATVCRAPRLLWQRLQPASAEQ